MREIFNSIYKQIGIDFEKWFKNVSNKVTTTKKPPQKHNMK